jgi:hypothetical protein
MKTVKFCSAIKNKNLYLGDYIVMVVAGPNRKNFHYNEGRIVLST